MTPKELLEHELAWFKGIAKLKLLGHWSKGLAGKRITVVVYQVKPYKSKKVGNYETSRRPRVKLAVSYGDQILTSLEVDVSRRRKK